MRMFPSIARLLSLTLAVSLVLASAAFSQSDEEKEKKRREIIEKMEALRQKKDQLKSEEREKITKIDVSSSKNRRESIALFEKIISSTQKGESRRCDAFFQLGALYYEDERETYGNGLESFKKDYEIWERRGSVGAPPVEPIPTYTKSVEAYKTLVGECPDYKSRDVVFYKLGNIFTVTGDFESAFESFNALLKDFPGSENAPFAHLRIGEYYYQNRDNANAIKHYEAVGMKSGADNYMLSLYRIASCYYNMSQFDKAVDKFFEYIEMADSGKFPRADFRDEAIEYLAISFSESEGGAEKAQKFFEKKGGRPYQDFIIYTVGIKNRDHDNVKEAIKSLNFLIEKSPNYIEAPLAIKALIDCQVLEKKYEEANNLRVRLMKDYGPGSKWMTTYAGEKEKIKVTLDYIREAAAIIPIYYNKLGNIARDSAKMDRARGYYQQALDAYGRYVTTFPDDKWNAYTFRYFRAVLMYDSLIGRYADAAKEFDWVSREDTSAYPSRVVDQKKVFEERQKEQRDIKEQFKGDIKERVRIIQVNPEEAAFAALICLQRVAQVALKAKGFNDTTAYQGLSLPEMQSYLNAIRDYRNRFPKSTHASEVAFLEAGLQFDAHNWTGAIEGYKFVIANFGANEKLAKPAFDFLARAYLQNKEYDNAIATNKRLLLEFNPTAAEQKQISEAIAALVFLIADAKLKDGDFSGAAENYKSICIDYPTFSRADRALFNAAYAYEQGKMYAEAAREFERVYERFPAFERRKEAIFRAVRAYAMGKDYPAGAEVYLRFAKSQPRDSAAIPAVLSAAAMYDTAAQFVQAAKTYEHVYELLAESKKDKQLYPGAERESPGALYSAGLMYEKADNFQAAIGSYEKLVKAFPVSEYAPEASYSVAICWEKLSDDAKLAAAYIAFTEKYGSDRAKVVQSLLKAAKAFDRLGRRDDQEKMYRTIIQIYKEFGEKFGIDPRSAAEAYYVLGEHAYEKYAVMDLRTVKMGAAGAKEIEIQLKDKSKALEAPLKMFTDCIALQTEEWTTRATHQCGEIFWNLMEAVKNQPVVEKDPAKIAYGRVKINEALAPYYEMALKNYFTNVSRFRNEMGVRNEWTEKSADRFAQGWYQLCFSHIENGDIFSAAPNPFPRGTQEYDEYQLQIQTVVAKLQEKCAPCLEEGLTQSVNAAIDNSWVARMRKELERQAPASEALKLQAKALPAPGTAPTGSSGNRVDAQYERSKKALQNVYTDSDLSLDKKISILQGMESSAKRRIEELTEEISRLKAK